MAAAGQEAENEVRVIDYAEIARQTKTVRAGCCDCGVHGDWIGDDARDKARAHGMEHGHFIWIEGMPV